MYLTPIGLCAYPGLLCCLILILTVAAARLRDTATSSLLPQASKDRLFASSSIGLILIY
jgi:hypothetical protein